MTNHIETNGKNLTYLKENMLANKMDLSDFDQLVQKAVEVFQHLPNEQSEAVSEQGLLLGLVQSGKTGALTTVTAPSA